MPTTGSADRDGYALEPVAATVPPEVPHQVGTPLIGTPDEHLLARFLLGYRDRTRAAYLADMRDFQPGAPGPASG